MGTYLVTGVVQNITIYKKTVHQYDVPISNVINALQNEVNIECYRRSEDENNFYWKINPEMLEGSFVEFLETQFQMYSGTETDQFMEEAIGEVTKAKSGEKRMALAAQCNLFNFQLITVTDHIEVLHTNGWLKRNIAVGYDLISIFQDGKIIMECYNNILHYFTQNIRLQREKYPVVDCIKLAITN